LYKPIRDLGQHVSFAYPISNPKILSKIGGKRRSQTFHPLSNYALIDKELMSSLYKVLLKEG
jgi:hypothetical protein